MIARQIYSASSVALIILMDCHGKSSIQEEEEEEEEWGGGGGEVEGEEGKEGGDEEEEEGGGGGGEEEEKKEKERRRGGEKEKEKEEEDTLHLSTGHKFKGKTSTLLHWEKSFARCWNVDTSEGISEIPVKFLNVVLEKGGEEQLDRSWARNEEVLQRFEERNVLQAIEEGRLTGLVKSCIGIVF